MNATQRSRFEKFLLAERERHERLLTRVAGAREACTRPIPLDRLRLVPGAVFCQSHAYD